MSSKYSSYSLKPFDSSSLAFQEMLDTSGVWETISSCNNFKYTASMKFKSYRHGGSGYAKRKRSTDWKTKRDMLTELHDQGVSRKVMRDRLQLEGFDVSPGQLVR